MKKLLLTLSLFGLSLLAVAGEKIDKTITAAENGFVNIEHLNGKAEIKGWDKAQIKVIGELGDDIEKFIFERNGNQVLIKVRVKNRNKWANWRSDKGDKLTIFVPVQSVVSYDSVNSDVEARGLKGGSTLETVNGDIQAQELAGRIRIESVNGDISTHSLEGDVNIESVNGDIESTSSKGGDGSYASVNGDITVTSESADIKVETVNGDMDLHFNGVDKLHMDTVNGRINAQLNLLNKASVDVSSVGGAIQLHFQSDVSARFDIQAHAGGRINNNLSKHAMKKAKYGPNRWLDFSLNEGSAKVDISTVNGKVVLDKQ